jgi:hypothetical protein
MLGLLVRWAVRLFFFALIAGAVGFVVTRLLGGEDEDFDDYEDLEANFEFNETPVEIDVSGPATSDTSTSDISTSDTGTPSSSNAVTEIGDGDEAATGDNGSGRSSSSSDTVILDNRLDENAAPTVGDLNTSSNGASDGSRLIDIKGIGPGYESRLRAIGINTLGDLIDTDAQQIVEQAGVNGGVALVEDWKEQARALIAEGQE